MALWCLSCALSWGAENSPPATETLAPKDAYAMIDRGAFTHTKLPAYKAVSYQAADRKVIITTEFVRLSTEGLRSVRVERRKGDDLTIHLQNVEGKWLIRGGHAARIANVTQLWQTIPLRPPGLSGGEAKFEVMDAADYHGLSLQRVTAGAGPVPAEGRNAASAGKPRVSKHEYFFDPARGLLLAWHAVTASGEIVKEVGYQEFTVGEQPASLFELPAGVTVVEPQDQEEWTRYFGSAATRDPAR